MQAYCPWCGTGWRAGWRFCPGCGRPGTQDGGRVLSRRQSHGPSWPQALAAFQEGELEKAAAELEALVRTGRRRGEALALLGAIALRRRQLQDAWRLLEEALAEAPTSPLVRLKRAQYFAALGAIQRAQGELEAALIACPPGHGQRPLVEAALATLERRRRLAVERSPALPPVGRLLRLAVARQRGEEVK